VSEHKNLIAGDWVAGPRAQRNVNPSDTHDVVGEYAQADAAQAKQAIDAAHAAFPKWAGATPQQRFDALDFIGSEICAAPSFGDLSRARGRQDAA
jgi:aldehyde dehydrogenase (NAD+)